MPEKVVTACYCNCLFRTRELAPMIRADKPSEATASMNGIFMLPQFFLGAESCVIIAAGYNRAFVRACMPIEVSPTRFHIYQKDSSTGWIRSLKYLQEQAGLPKIGLGVEEPFTPRMDTRERGLGSRATVVRRRVCRSLICAGGLGIRAVVREG